MTVVLGHFPDYTKLAGRLSMPYFQIDPPILAGLSDAEIWTINRQFLDRSIAAGARFALATPQGQARPGSWFARELSYLRGLGVGCLSPFPLRK